MHILITDLYTFLMKLVRRICLNIKISYPQWSLPLFLSLEYSNKQCSCKEKFHFHQGLGLKGLKKHNFYGPCVTIKDTNQEFLHVITMYERYNSYNWVFSLKKPMGKWVNQIQHNYTCMYCKQLSITYQHSACCLPQTHEFFQWFQFLSALILGDKRNA